MSPEQIAVRDFHKRFGCVYANTPTVQPPTVLLRRVRLMNEELAEFVSAASEGNMVGMADALADLLYVTYGAAVALGLDMEPIFAAVHESNMTKCQLADAGGKIMKGPAYTPPDVCAEIEKQLSEPAERREADVG